MSGLKHAIKVQNAFQVQLPLSSVANCKKCSCQPQLIFGCGSNTTSDQMSVTCHWRYCTIFHDEYSSGWVKVPTLPYVLSRSLQLCAAYFFAYRCSNNQTTRFQYVGPVGSFATGTIKQFCINISSGTPERLFSQHCKRELTMMKLGSLSWPCSEEAASNDNTASRGV